MAFREDLSKALEDNLKEKSFEDCAKNIVNAYKKSVNISTDIFGNKITGVNFNLIEQTLSQTFNLCLETGVNFNYKLLQIALVNSWLGSKVVLPALPALPITQVLDGTIISSFSAGNLPLLGSSKSNDSFLNSLFLFFTNHSKTITINYTGIVPGSPTPIIIPSVGIVLK